MKLCISLPEEDVGFVDAYARSHGIESRSRVIRTALRLLRRSELAEDYASAWTELDEGEVRTWDRSSPDGLTP